MNTATHTVGVPFPQAFAAPICCLFPSAPRYRMRLARLTRDMSRSNQTARCDECASTQTRIESSRCLLVPCELTFCSASSLSWLSRLLMNIQPLSSSLAAASRLFIPRLKDGGFQDRFL